MHVSQWRGATNMVASQQVLQDRCTPSWTMHTLVYSHLKRHPHRTAQELLLHEVHRDAVTPLHTPPLAALPRLQRLRLDFHYFDSTTAAAMACAPWLTQLRVLHLDCPRSESGFAPLRGRELPLLEELGLQKLDAANAAHVAAAALPALRRLQLSHCHADALVSSTLCAAPWASQLTDLALQELHAFNGAAALAGAPLLALTSLSLSSPYFVTSLRPDLVAPLAGAAWLPQLVELRLSGNPLLLAGGGELPAPLCCELPALRRLLLDDCARELANTYVDVAVQPATAAALAAAPWLPQLELLSLRTCNFAADALEAARGVVAFAAAEAEGRVALD